MAVTPLRLGMSKDAERTWVPYPLSTSEAEDAFGVAVVEFFQERIGEAELVPFLEQARVGDARIIAAEHHLVLEPAAHVADERGRQIFRRPARHLPIDI